MLQQTQVPRVVPRFEAWMARWPTVEALAAAGSSDVIRAWQGLGYNRRAVNLHRAAQRVAADGWPDDLTLLPGVGEYTASAVRRFAFGEPVLPLDTNVRRVVERTGGSFGPESAEALMDLGRGCALHAFRAAVSVRWLRSARPAAGATSRFGSSRASKDRSASAGRRRCDSSPPDAPRTSTRRRWRRSSGTGSWRYAAASPNYHTKAWRATRRAHPLSRTLGSDPPRDGASGAPNSVDLSTVWLKPVYRTCERVPFGDESSHARDGA